MREDSPFVKHVLDVSAGDPMLDASVSDKLAAQEEFTATPHYRPSVVYARVGPLFGWATVSRKSAWTDEYSGSGFSTGVDVGAGFRAGRWLLGPYFRWQTTFLSGTVQTTSAGTAASGPLQREDGGQLIQLGGEAAFLWHGSRTVAPMMRMGFGYGWLSGIGLMNSVGKGFALGVSGGVDLSLGRPAWHLGLGGDFTWGYFTSRGATPPPTSTGYTPIQTDDNWSQMSFLGMVSLTTP
jgi:hypothetical protein